MSMSIPGKSGIEGIERIRSVSPASKVVVLTIHGEDDKVFSAICAGASGYLLKPSDPARIISALRDVQKGAAPINPYIARRVLGMFSRLAPSREPVDDYGLTGREREILQLLVDGLKMKRIATELNLSYHTISNHLRNIYHKLHVHSRSSAVAKALQEDLL